MTISVRPLTVHIGAEISSVDLSQPDDAEIKEIKDLLMKHLVLFFRDQDMTAAEHVDFGRQFGDLHIHNLADANTEHPEIIDVVANEQIRPQNDAWHSDVTMDAEPPMGAILRAIEVPEVGGDTIWASMYAAYEALPSSVQTMCGDLVAVHHYPERFRRNIVKQEDGYARLEQYDRDHPPVEHPVVRRHPVTGRPALFVNSGFTKYIKDMGVKQSEGLLEMLLGHISAPEFQVRFKWEPGSVAIWDNRCTQHYAVADFFPARRHMQRVTIAGDRPQT